MNATFRNGIHLVLSAVQGKYKWLVMMCVMLFASNWSAFGQACLQVEKTLLAVAPASSGATGHFDATFRIQVVGVCGITSSIQVVDRLNQNSNLGSAFVGVVGLPVLAYVSPSSNAGGVNPGFNGASDPNVNDGSAFLLAGDTMLYQITVEVNPKAFGAPSILQNSAQATYLIPNPGATVFSNIAVIPDCWSDCQMACNNLVQVSVNSICEADILADMILEGEVSECASLGFFEVTIYYNNKKVHLPLDQTYLNQKLKVNVRNIVCNNNCWGYIVLEDKTAPVLNCRLRDTISCAADASPAALGFPVPINKVDQSVYPYLVSGIDACGFVYLTYRDSLVRYDCSNDSLSATIYRKWCATDPGGYTACCIDTIDLRRGTLADITLPPHYDGQPGNRPYLKCDGLWAKLPNGFPDTTAQGTGKPNGVYCGNIQYDFTDDTIQVCKGTYKLLRRWLILDWCNPSRRIDYIQQIKVVDDKVPVITCPSTFTVNTNPWTCAGTLILPVPQELTPQTVVDNRIPYVIENCSGWTYSVKHLPAINSNDCTPAIGQGNTQNIVKLPDGRYQINDMPLGCNWIYYTVTDGCGNSTVCQFDIVVKDLTPPVAVCHQKTVISLGSNGLASVPASVFDDHSHDNCGGVSFRVRRMNQGPCGTTRFDDTQEFCCDDVSATNPVRVVVEVSDRGGNRSECMVDAFVQDKLTPKVTCPKDTVVNCGTDLSNLSVFGKASATDNCHVTMQSRVYNNLNSCNVGILVREFIGVDNGGLRDSCQQLIRVVDPTPFGISDIIWPRDTVLNGCADNASPDFTKRPIYLNKDQCNQPIASFEDLTFNYVEGVCFKILRKWTVIDWCSYNPANNTGIWYHTQVIKINNSEPPRFTSSCETQYLCITNGCSLFHTLEASATDNCTSQDDLRWSYQIDLGNDNSTDLSGNRNRVSANYQAGTHRISWTVEDQCGNKNTCSYLIIVKDCKRPTPYCRQGLITVLMQNTGSVTVWAKDFDLASDDNCTPKSELKFSFSSNIKDSSRVFTCADIANGKSDTVSVDIYVTDKDGNQDYCRTELILQDNQNVCPDVPTFGSISGAIKGYKNNPSPNVRVVLKNQNGLEKELATDYQGTYVFNDLEMYSDYSVTAHFDSDPLQGITTKDIVKIQRHILGIEILDSPYKMIAADVNKSGTITASDISELRKMILGVQNHFDKNQSWNFVDANVALTPDNFKSFSSEFQIKQLDNITTNGDFMAIKTGDVTGEAVTGFYGNAISREGKSILFEIPELTYRKDDLLEIPVRCLVSDEIFGFQIELNINEMDYEFVSLDNGLAHISSDQYHYEGGHLRISWNPQSSIVVDNSNVLFKLRLKAKSSGVLNLNSIQINSQGFASEMYFKNSDRNIALVYRLDSSGDHAGGFDLYQNVPNPFQEKTTIYFQAPKASVVSMELFDLNGKLLKNYLIDAKAGINSLEINSDELGTRGVIYYRLDTKDFSSTRKMIIIK